MVRSTMVNGMKASPKDSELKSGQMVDDMKVIGTKENQSERE